MIFGVDPGIVKTHIVVLNREGDLIDFTDIYTPKLTTKQGMNELAGRTRPQYIAEQVEVWLGVFRVLGLQESHVFIEEPVVAGKMNLRTAIQMARAAGAIEAVMHGKHEIWPTHMVPVDTWKNAVIGAGGRAGTDKEAVNAWVKAQHLGAWERLGGNQDFCDAYCIARYGMGYLQEAESGGAVHQNTQSPHSAARGKRFTSSGKRV